MQIFHKVKKNESQNGKKLYFALLATFQKVSFFSKRTELSI